MLGYAIRAEIDSTHATLQPVLVLLGVAVLVVVFRHLKLPPLLGYLIVGVSKRSPYGAQRNTGHDTAATTSASSAVTSSRDTWAAWCRYLSGAKIG